MQNPVVKFTFSFLFFLFSFFFFFGHFFFVPNAEFSGGVHFFCFRPETIFLVRFGPKIQHCQFKRKFSPQTNLIMQNSMTVFIFPVLDEKDHFQANLDKKSQNCQFCSKTSWNMQNSIVLFNFFILHGKQPFLANLVQKMISVSFSRNLERRLIRICKIQQWCSLFQFQIKTPLLRKFGPKHQNCQFNLKFGTYTN